MVRDPEFILGSQVRARRVGKLTVNERHPALEGARLWIGLSLPIGCARKGEPGTLGQVFKSLSAGRVAKQVAAFCRAVSLPPVQVKGLRAVLFPLRRRNFPTSPYLFRTPASSLAHRVLKAWRERILFFQGL